RTSTRLGSELGNLSSVWLCPHRVIQSRAGSARFAKPDREDIHKTMLNAFFNLCHAQPESTRDLLYPDCPSKFTWDLKSKVWNLRKNNHETIGRVTFCPPSAGERYYLRMLLYAVKGPISFDDLKTYNGKVIPIFWSL